MRRLKFRSRKICWKFFPSITKLSKLSNYQLSKDLFLHRSSTSSLNDKKSIDDVDVIGAWNCTISRWRGGRGWNHLNIKHKFETFSSILKKILWLPNCVGFMCFKHLFIYQVALIMLFFSFLFFFFFFFLDESFQQLVSVYYQL